MAGRVRRTPDQWLELVARQRASGLSVAEFARRENLAYQSLSNWCRKCANTAVAVAQVVAKPVPELALPEFIELGVTTPGLPSNVAPEPATTGWLVELELGGGLTLRVRQPA